MRHKKAACDTSTIDVIGGLSIIVHQASLDELVLMRISLNSVDRTNAAYHAS